MAIAVVTAFLMQPLCPFAMLAGLALTLPALVVGIVAIPTLRRHRTVFYGTALVVIGIVTALLPWVFLAPALLS